MKEEICFPEDLNIYDYEQLKHKWETLSDVTIDFSSEISDLEARKLFAVMIEHLADDFAVAVLENLAEVDHIPIELLEELFSHNLTGCNVSICLRKDLSRGLLKKCLASSDPNVIEHAVFNELVTADECNRLLLSVKDEATKQAIQRAIKQKKMAGQ